MTRHWESSFYYYLHSKTPTWRKTLLYNRNQLLCVDSVTHRKKSNTGRPQVYFYWSFSFNKEIILLKQHIWWSETLKCNKEIYNIIQILWELFQLWAAETVHCSVDHHTLFCEEKKRRLSADLVHLVLKNLSPHGCNSSFHSFGKTRHCSTPTKYQVQQSGMKLCWLKQNDRGLVSAVCGSQRCLCL